VESLVRGLASRWVRNQASYLDAALGFWFDGTRVHDYTPTAPPPKSLLLLLSLACTQPLSH
jgi:hypothetical protein